MTMLVNQAYFENVANLFTGSFTIPATTAGNTLVICAAATASNTGGGFYDGLTITDDAGDLFLENPYAPDMSDGPDSSAVNTDMWYCYGKGGATTISFDSGDNTAPGAPPSIWVYEIEPSVIADYSIDDGGTGYGGGPSVIADYSIDDGGTGYGGGSFDTVSPGSITTSVAAFCVGVIAAADSGANTLAITGIDSGWTLDTVNSDINGFAALGAAYLDGGSNTQAPNFTLNGTAQQFSGCVAAFIPVASVGLMALHLSYIGSFSAVGLIPQYQTVNFKLNYMDRVGNTSQFIIPVAGTWLIGACIQESTAAPTLQLRVNGVVKATLVGGQNTIDSGSFPTLQRGDVVDLYHPGTEAVTGISLFMAGPIQPPTTSYEVLGPASYTGDINDNPYMLVPPHAGGDTLTAPYLSASPFQGAIKFLQTGLYVVGGMLSQTSTLLGTDTASPAGSVGVATVSLLDTDVSGASGYGGMATQSCALDLAVSGSTSDEFIALIYVSALGDGISTPNMVLLIMGSQYSFTMPDDGSTRTVTLSELVVMRLLGLTGSTTTPSVLEWPTLSTLITGQSLADCVLSGGLAAAGGGLVAGSFAFTDETVVPPVGSNPQSITFTPADLTIYAPVVGSVMVTVVTALPVITWTTPASIVAGTALTSVQLIATASVSGSFVYDPPLGTILPVGLNTLSVTFTPDDLTTYAVVTQTVTILVISVVVAQIFNITGIIRVGGTCFLMFVGNPNVAVQWSVVGDGGIEALTPYTDAYGKAYARYTATAAGPETIEVEYGT